MASAEDRVWIELGEPGWNGVVRTGLVALLWRRGEVRLGQVRLGHIGT